MLLVGHIRSPEMVRDKYELSSTALVEGISKTYFQFLEFQTRKELDMGAVFLHLARRPQIGMHQL